MARPKEIGGAENIKGEKLGNYKKTMPRPKRIGGTENVKGEKLG